jgi:uncharacterized RDD family membrane protein YckC
VSSPLQDQQNAAFFRELCAASARGPSAPARRLQNRLGLTLAEPAGMGNLLWLIIIVLVIMWLGGFAMHIGGGLIHILIVIALILLIVRLATGRKVL